MRANDFLTSIERIFFFFPLHLYSVTGEGNGNPLQYSCLENPMDRGAPQAAVHGVPRVGYNLVIKPPPPPCSVNVVINID